MGVRPGWGLWLRNTDGLRLKNIDLNFETDGTWGSPKGGYWLCCTLALRTGIAFLRLHLRTSSPFV